MPRSGPNGQYSLPAIYLATPGTTIVVAQHNDPLEDIQTALNTAQPIFYGGTGQSTAAAALAALFGQPAENIGFSASVAANALTIALKGTNGADPSATNPVIIRFRSPTATLGTSSSLTITTATSLLISPTSTMGFTSGVEGRLVIVGFDDGGTFRLGAINLPNGFPLPVGIASSTAEGGAGGADSINVIYTGTAVTSKAVVVLGYLLATEATAGTWVTAPSLIQTATPEVLVSKLSNGLVSGTRDITTGGTEIIFPGLPAWIKKITMTFVGLSTNGTADILVRIGDSGGFETSGYSSLALSAQNASAITGTASTVGFNFGSGNATNAFHGPIILTFDGTTWVASWNLRNTNGDFLHWGAGSKALSATLDRIGITAANGTDTFDVNGGVNILYEG